MRKKDACISSHLSISTRQATHTGKSHGAARFLWRMQLQIQYIAMKLIAHVYLHEEPGEFHAHEAAGCHQEGAESHHVHT